MTRDGITMNTKQGSISRAAVRATALLAAVSLAAALGAAGCAPKREASPGGERGNANAVPESTSVVSTGDAAADSAFADTSEQAAPDSDAGPPLSPWEDARRRGVTFRAIGQEPGWVVEVTDDAPVKRLHFLYAYGESSLAIDDATIQVDTKNARATYRGAVGGRTLEVELSDGPCADVMSGESFETRVEVRFEGTTFSGCGRSLRAAS